MSKQTGSLLGRIWRLAWTSPPASFAKREIKKLAAKVAAVQAPGKADFRTMGSRVHSAFGNAGDKPRTLLVTSNGAGLGHLTRVAAISEYLDGEDLIYTMSSAYKLLGRPREKTIYFPSYSDIGMDGSKWNPFMAAHLQAVVEAFEPDLIVFDGTFVYRGVVEAAKSTGIPLVWLQRGCWREEISKASHQRNNPDAYVDFVVVPGDCGSSEALPEVPKVPTYSVGPIVIADRKQMLSRAEARERLHLPQDKKLVLIQLGAGVINKNEDEIGAAIEAVHQLGPDWEPVLVRNPLKHHSSHGSVTSIETYPLMRYFNAFHFGVFAGGYNSCQEAAAAALPAVFVPNTATKTDDQIRRVNGMVEKGLGLKAKSLDELKAAICQLGDSEVRETLRWRMGDLPSLTGAAEAAEVLDNLIKNSSSAA